MTPNLTRTAGMPTPPIRLVHIGLGAFHRAHQVWYTQKAEPEPRNPQWGYASFTGRSARMAELLSGQGGLYTLVTRSGDGDSAEVMTSLVEVQPADNLTRLVGLVADPRTAVVTLTVTEAGYHLTSDGSLDTGDRDISDDARALRDALSAPHDFDGSLATAAGRIVLGLAARRQAGEGGLAVMSCDNVADNGALTRASVIGFAEQLDAELARWIRANVTFPSTSIDRITPASDDELIGDVEAATGVRDLAPVVTEPFSSWVISGDFPAGRPEWERSGVVFVDDIEPFERRKLWLLNGSHSLMAYYGQLCGRTTVAEAINDPDIRSKVEALWDEAAHHLTADELKIPEYRASLIERFENPRIRHNLAQIGIDGATKQRMRARAILRAELAEGRDGRASAFSIAGWIAYLLGAEEIKDTRADELSTALSSTEPVRALIGVLDEELAADDAVVTLIENLVTGITTDSDQ